LLNSKKKIHLLLFACKASILAGPDGQFINLSRLNLNKYSENPLLSRPLFEYIFYHENDIRSALQLASLATEVSNFNDWWWKVQLGKCYFRLGLFRDAEKQYLSAIKQHTAVDIYLYLSKVYIKLDQPLNSIARLKEANEKFPNETSILQSIARIYEVRIYKTYLQSESIFYLLYITL
jgi:tetratricopeptide repeat protein 8